MFILKLTEIKCAGLKYCKDFTTSHNYLIGFSGKQVRVYDDNFELIANCEGLSYVYNGEVSPDGKKLLLFSSNNGFYICDFPTLTGIKKTTLRAPFNEECMGCWSYDGKEILLCIKNCNTLNSTLRLYRTDNTLSFVELIKEKYWLMFIGKAESKSKYFFIGYNRKNFKTYILWFDGENFEEYHLKEFDEIATNVKYNSSNNLLEIYSENCVYFYNHKGEIIFRKFFDLPIENEFSFSNIFKDMKFEEGDIKQIKHVSDILGLEKIKLNDEINDICFVPSISTLYIASLNGIYVYNTETFKLIDKIKIDYGVNQIKPLGERKIILSTWNGVRIFELI